MSPSKFGPYNPLVINLVLFEMNMSIVELYGDEKNILSFGFV